MKIIFLIGSVDISGGSYAIYQHAQYASQKGHDVTIAALLPYTFRELAWHPATRDLRIMPFDQVGNEVFDMAIATWWKTALALHRINAKQYAYFVQSIESRFYANDPVSLRNLVDSTYALPLPVITVASWVHDYLLKNFGHNCHLVRNGIRKDLYEATGPSELARPEGGTPRFLVEGPFGVSFKNVGGTLRLLRKARARDVWLLTSTDVGWYPAVGRVFSRIPVEKVGPIYRSCDVIVKLSYVEGMFGPPLEMFHCGGTAVVFNVTGCDEYIIDGQNALVVRSGDERGAVAAVHRLMHEPTLLAHLKAGAMRTAAGWPSWEESSAKFLVALGEILCQPQVTRQTIEEHNRVAWEKYLGAERTRLQSSPFRNSGHYLMALARRLPESLKRHLRMVKYLYEGYL